MVADGVDRSRGARRATCRRSPTPCASCSRDPDLRRGWAAAQESDGRRRPARHDARTLAALFDELPGCSVSDPLLPLRRPLLDVAAGRHARGVRAAAAPGWPATAPSCRSTSRSTTWTPQGRLPRGMVALTFDDGFPAAATTRLPDPRRVTDCRRPSSLSPRPSPTRVTPVDWVDTAPDVAAGDADLRPGAGGRATVASTFGSHSWTHPRLHRARRRGLPRGPAPQSRELLEDLLQQPVAHLAYPRGLHDAMARRAAEHAGYTHSFALPTATEEPGATPCPASVSSPATVREPCAGRPSRRTSPSGTVRSLPLLRRRCGGARERRDRDPGPLRRTRAPEVASNHAAVPTLSAAAGTLSRGVAVSGVVRLACEVLLHGMVLSMFVEGLAAGPISLGRVMAALGAVDDGGGAGPTVARSLPHPWWRCRRCC